MTTSDRLQNFEAAGLIAGMACAFELRKLALVKLMSDQIDRDFEGKSADAKAEAVQAAREGLGRTIWKEIKPFGQAAVNAGIGATVGTYIGHSIGKKQEQKGPKGKDEGPEMFRSGFELGMREGMTHASQQGIPKTEKK